MRLRHGFEVRREMAGQQTAYGVDPGDRARFESARAEVLFHETAHGRPFGGADTAVQTPVRDDFDVPIRHLNVYEHAIVVLGVPDAKMREHFERTGARRHAVD